MPTRLLQTTCFAVCALTAGAASNCSNPVFLGDGLFGAPALELNTDGPLPYSSQTTDGPCSAYADMDVCCSESALEQIDFYFELGDTVLNATGMLIENNDYPTEVESLISGEMDLVCSFVSQDLFPTLYQDCEQASDIVSQYSADMVQAAEDVASAEIKCAQALATYYKGVLCFACEPSWDKYLIRDADNVVTALNLNNNTCASIVEECAAVNTAVHKVADVAVEFVDSLLDLFSSGSTSFSLSVDSLVDSLPDACGGTMGSAGDCTDYYCRSSAVSGMQTPTQTNWGFLSGSSRALEALKATTSSNLYTATGYDAYSVGEADSGEDATAPWVAAAVAVPSVAVVIGVAVYIRRRMTSSRSTHFSSSW